VPYLQSVKAWLTDGLLLGLESSDAAFLQQGQTCYDQGKALGFDHLLTPLGRLLTELNRRPQDPHWQATASTRAVRDLWVWLSFADNLSS
jgi:hypothetical protein